MFQKFGPSLIINSMSVQNLLQFQSNVSYLNARKKSIKKNKSLRRK